MAKAIAVTVSRATEPASASQNTRVLPAMSAPTQTSMASTARRTVVVSMVCVTTVLAAEECARAARVPLASKAASAMSPRDTAVPEGWLSSATSMLAALARKARPGVSASMVLKVMASPAPVAIPAHTQAVVAAQRTLNVSLETWAPTAAFATKAGVGMAACVWPLMNVGWTLEVAVMWMLSAATWALDRVDAHASWALLEMVTSAAPLTPAGWAMVAAMAWLLAKQLGEVSGFVHAPLILVVMASVAMETSSRNWRQMPTSLPSPSGSRIQVSLFLLAAKSLPWYLLKLPSVG